MLDDPLIILKTPFYPFENNIRKLRLNNFNLYLKNQYYYKDALAEIALNETANEDRSIVSLDFEDSMNYYKDDVLTINEIATDWHVIKSDLKNL